MMLFASLNIQWAVWITRAFWAIVLVGGIYYLLHTKQISVEAVERVGNMMSTIGGQIFILVVFTFVFFVSAMGFGYYVIDAVQNKTLDPNDTMATVLIEFVTGTAFGTSLGALIQLIGASKGLPKEEKK